MILGGFVVSKQRDWFKWKMRAGRRGTIRRAAKVSGNGFETMGACVAMLDHARGESHWIGNPEGAFTTSIEDLAIDYSTPEERVRASLSALVSKGWLNASPDVSLAETDEQVSFRVVKYLAFNDPQGSDADRKASERDRNSLIRLANAIGALNTEPEDLQVNVTACPLVTGESLEEKRREEKKENTSDKESDHTQIRSLFDLWLAETGRSAAQNRLTDKRRGLVRGRLREGYTFDQLQEAIIGIAKSPWHTGDNPGGTRYDTFDFIMRSGENVEKGMERAVGSANVAASRNSGIGVSVLDANAMYTIEEMIGRGLTSEEESELRSGVRSVEVFLAEHGVTAAGAA